MKYVIEIPDDNISDFLTLGDDKRLRLPMYNKNGTFNSFIPTNLTVIPYTDPDRKAVEDEVWQFAKDIRLKSFIEDGCLYGYISEFDTYQEAKAKYEALKKQEEAICVGDEVKHKKLPELKIYVTDMDDNSFGGFALCSVEDVCDYGDRFSECNVHQYEPTGRVLPNIVELLKKMKED